MRTHTSFTSGVSVRAGLALIAGARARALLHGRDFVLPEDIETLWISTLAHRLELSYEAEGEGVSISQVLIEILEHTQTPDVQA